MTLTLCFLLLCSYTTQDHLSEVVPPLQWVDVPTVVNLNCLKETGIYLLNKVENIHQQKKDKNWLPNIFWLSRDRNKILI